MNTVKNFFIVHKLATIILGIIIVFICIISIVFSNNHSQKNASHKGNNTSTTKKQKRYMYIKYTWNGKEVRNVNDSQTKFLEFEKSYKNKDVLKSLTIPSNMEPVKGQKAIMTGTPNQHVTIKIKPHKDNNGNMDHLYSIEVKENGKWKHVEKDPFEN